MFVMVIDRCRMVGLPSAAFPGIPRQADTEILAQELRGQFRCRRREIDILGISGDAYPAGSIPFPTTMNCSSWNQTCHRQPAHFRLIGAELKVGRRTPSVVQSGR